MKFNENADIARYDRGDQIVYVPSHVRSKGSLSDWLNHSDVEFGFVWEDEGDTVLCRFFRGQSEDLRTRANSERADREDIFWHMHKEINTIQYWIKAIERSGDHSLPKIS